MKKFGEAPTVGDFPYGYYSLPTSEQPEQIKHADARPLGNER